MPEEFNSTTFDAQQPRKASAELQEIQKPLELVAFFHRALGRTTMKFEEHETAYADELLAGFSESEVRDLIRYGICRLGSESVVGCGVH